VTILFLRAYFLLEAISVLKVDECTRTADYAVDDEPIGFADMLLQTRTNRAPVEAASVFLLVYRTRFGSPWVNPMMSPCLEV
jgi:hypothetical protein